MGQVLLLAGLLGVVGVLPGGAPGQEPTPSPSPVETASEVRVCAGDLVDCWLEAERGTTVSVLISEPLGEVPADLAVRLAATGEEERARLVVSVVSESGTGGLGTVLFALAGEGGRYADPEALIDPIGEQERGACGGECREAAARLGGEEPLVGEELIAAGVAREAASGLVVPPGEGEDDDGGGGTSPLVVSLAAVLGALFAALLALLVAAVRRTSSPGPAPRRRGREAMVRTVLHPQGYVEIDGILHRAEWAEPHGSTPVPGERVDVVEQDGGVLLAYRRIPGGAI
jgi:hypothetical protein